MTFIHELVVEQAGLDDDAADHIQRLLADWQILADLSFADLLLFVKHTANDGAPAYLCVGQMRPYTAQTIYQDDLVGTSFPATDRPMVGRAYAEARVIRDTDPDWSTGVPVREEAIPVCHGGETVAVVTREANVSTARSPSNLELTYLQSAGELAQMLADGTFPYPMDTLEERDLSPRVGDGILRLDAMGRSTYASPNAVSAYRRLGMVENVIGQKVTDFDPSPDELMDALLHGVSVEIELEAHGSVVNRRVLPLMIDGEVTGALLLVREITELRRHERALRVKDATIREIHHRVKNNLQTVASLLRLQGRRLGSGEAREQLAESVRRISSIALVHETLSQESRQKVPFDIICSRIVDMLSDGLTSPDTPVSFEVSGSPGELPAEVATPLALVLSELLQNSLEHAFPAGEAQSNEAPTVRVHFERGPVTLRVLVSDNGVGLPDGNGLDALANLGLRIARTLVESELGGTFDAVDDGEPGTTVELVLPLL